jgi:hypothetical protein
VNSLVLVTVNTEDFARFRELEVENWSKRQLDGIRDLTQRLQTVVVSLLFGDVSSRFSPDPTLIGREIHLP